MNDVIKSIAPKNGVIAGVAIIFLYVIFYVVDVELLASLSIGMLIVLGFIILGFITIAKVKSKQEGFITFKEAFTSYIVPIAIGLLMSTLFIYILFNFIDTEAAAMLKDINLEKAEELMRKFGAPEAEITKEIAKAEAQDSYAINNVLLQYGGTLIFTAVIGLIGALTMKKKREDLG